MPAAKTDQSRPDRMDRAALRNLSEAEIERIAADDEDNPATAEDHWADAMVGLPPVEVAVNATFDADVVTWFNGQGCGYRGRMTAVLRMDMDAQAKKTA